MTESKDPAYDCGFLTDVVSADLVSLERSERERFSADASPHDASLPDAVVRPETTAEVSAVLVEANERGEASAARSISRSTIPAPSRELPR